MEHNLAEMQPQSPMELAPIQTMDDEATLVDTDAVRLLVRRLQDPTYTNANNDGQPPSTLGSSRDDQKRYAFFKLMAVAIFFVTLVGATVGLCLVAGNAYCRRASWSKG